MGHVFSILSWECQRDASLIARLLSEKKSEETSARTDPESITNLQSTEVKGVTVQVLQSCLAHDSHPALPYYREWKI